MKGYRRWCYLWGRRSHFVKSLCNTAHVIKEARLRPIEIVACSNPSYTWRQLKCHVVMPDGTKQQLGRPPPERHEWTSLLHVSKQFRMPIWERKHFSAKTSFLIKVMSNDKLRLSNGPCQPLIFLSNVLCAVPIPTHLLIVPCLTGPFSIKKSSPTKIATESKTSSISIHIYQH